VLAGVLASAAAFAAAHGFTPTPDTQEFIQDDGSKREE
jgi:hypothetical protein